MATEVSWGTEYLPTSGFFTQMPAGWWMFRLLMLSKVARRAAPLAAARARIISSFSVNDGQMSRNAFHIEDFVALSTRSSFRIGCSLEL